VKRVIDRAEVILGDRGLARDWLATPNAALGGGRPLDLLSTAAGEEGVLQVLGRIEGGVYG
jgi:putative toxin-antitoxin system antitoxin component (TIGR02293 family)